MRSLVPREFWHASGLDAYEFKVFEPWHKPYDSIFRRDGGRSPIANSAYCAVKTPSKIHQVFVPEAEAPDLFEAILHLGRAVLTGPMVPRFMQTFMAYERVATQRNPDITAIRHGLSHAPGSLSKPSTLASLNRIFGSHRIDLRSFHHRRLFYLHFAKLLMELDQILFARLRPRLAKWSIFRFM